MSLFVVFAVKLYVLTKNDHEKMTNCFGGAVKTSELDVESPRVCLSVSLPEIMWGSQTERTQD